MVLGDGSGNRHTRRWEVSAVNDEYRQWLLTNVRQRQWTHAAFAREVGVKRSTVQNWLSGEGRPSRKYVPRLAQMFGRPEYELWQFYTDGPNLEPTWNNLLLKDIVHIPKGATVDDLRVVIEQLKIVGEAMILGAMRCRLDERTGYLLAQSADEYHRDELAKQEANAYDEDARAATGSPDDRRRSRSERTHPAIRAMESRSRNGHPEDPAPRNGTDARA